MVEATDTNNKLAQIQAKISDYKQWRHCIEVAPGVVTPGKTKGQNMTLKNMIKMGLPKDCSGLRVLDIGASDGYFTFELEKRGAAVVSLERRTESQTGYAMLHEYFDSKAELVVDNIYNVTPEKYGTFDIILFLNVLYHLRNPMLGIDRVRTLCKANTKIFIQTIVIDSRFELPGGEEINLADISPQLANLPIAQFYAKDNIYRDPSVRWVTNIKGLEEMIKGCRFKLDRYELTGKNRIMCACTPSNDKEEELSYQFDYVDTNARVSI
ncbi:MAG: methyltransferase domain-containing protein [Cyanobacteria bacterium J06598_4]